MEGLCGERADPAGPLRAMAVTRMVGDCVSVGATDGTDGGVRPTGGRPGHGLRLGFDDSELAQGRRPGGAEPTHCDSGLAA
jgi:hypothetical protein